MSALEFTEAELNERAAKILGRPRLASVNGTGHVALRHGPFLGNSDFARQLRGLGAASAAVAILDARGLRTVDILRSKDQRVRVAMARHELQSWLKRHVPDISFTEIGRIFGRDHTTVTNACEKIRRFACEDELIARRQAIPRDEPDPS